MGPRDYSIFARDVRRYRPLVTVVLVTVVLIPSLVETITQDLSPLIVLARAALAFFLIGLLVWMVSSVVLRYARTLATRDAGTREASEAG